MLKYFFSTEVTSSKIISDRPLYLRTRKAYEVVKDLIKGNTLEIGCGEGYGVAIYHSKASQLTLIDKSGYSVTSLKGKYPEADVIQQRIPPLKNIPDNSFDSIVSFQVIEHIKNDALFLSEIFRVLKPGGKAFLTTPNADKTIVRNPWHYREYKHEELKGVLSKVFTNISIKGIEGNSKTDVYYRNNEASVLKILKLDVFSLHEKLPAWILKIPYELLNRMNRKKLLKQHKSEVIDINSEDYTLNAYSAETLDFFCILEK
ncbi:class I SAM-dependent methyltransferase [uncultured Tenacibaculum sp.]|uniref:class I SAM-dependent methyltransferase n=1 Tax=uncultured Tenacibaculum sp. TaxID=174713 RepID=UPI00260787F5|nr:class I SAM-dependent methyltransferase [uncultured Tenacibaculum sp.]